MHNLGISLIAHEGLTLEEAVAEVEAAGRGMHCVNSSSAEQEALAASPTRLADGTRGDGKEHSAAVRACLGNMRNWFSSVYWFHHESGRYRVDSWDDRSTPPYVNNEAAGEK